MITSSNHLFDSTILAGVRPFAVPSSAGVRPGREARVGEVPAMSASLWRESMKEETGHRTHHHVVRGLFGVISALGLGSVGYAAWQTCALLSGSTLHNAVSAFLH